MTSNPKPKCAWPFLSSLATLSYVTHLLPEYIWSLFGSYSEPGEEAMRTQIARGRASKVLSRNTATFVLETPENRNAHARSIH